MNELKKYNPEDAIILCGDESKTKEANFNQLAGPAYTLFVDGKLILCGGVRIYGLGEGWFLMSEKTKEKLKAPEFNGEKKLILKTAKEQLDRIIRDERLWKIYAEKRVSGNFIESFGFKEKKIFVKE